MNDVPENAAQSEVQNDAAARLKQDLTAVKNDVAHLTQQGTWEASPWPAVATAIPGRDGKARSRSRRGTGEESDGLVVCAGQRVIQGG